MAKKVKLTPEKNELNDIKAELKNVIDSKEFNNFDTTKKAVLNAELKHLSLYIEFKERKEKLK